jgi:hypothetical protein
MMTDQQTIEQMATRAYEKTQLMPMYGTRWIAYELREAEHQGWLRGHADGHKQAQGFRDRHEPMLFLLAWSLGWATAIFTFAVR